MIERGFRSLVSPLSLGLLSGTYALATVFMPRGYYARIMEEECYICGDGVTFLFLVVCLAAFFFGIWASSRSELSSKSPRFDIKNVDTRLIGALLSLSIAYSIIYIYAVITSFPDLISYALSGLGKEFRQDITDEFRRLNHLLPISNCSIIFSFYFINARSQSGQPCPRIYKLFVLSAIASVMLLIVLMQRSLLIPMLFSLTIVKLHFFQKSVNFSIRKLIKNLGLFFLALILLFFVTSLARGNLSVAGSGSDVDSAAYGLVGYFFSSYNRLALALSGGLIMPNEGVGYYTFGFLFSIPGVDVYSLDVFRSFDVPESRYINWLGQFAAMESNGLNPEFIWLSVFGTAFLDWGYFSVFYFALYGLFCGYMFNRFNSGDYFGICFYPFVGQNIIQWFADNGLSSPWMIPQILVALAIASLARWASSRAEHSHLAVPS